MLVCEFSGRYIAVLVVILLFKDIFYHSFMMSVIGRVSMSLKLFTQVLFNLGHNYKSKCIKVSFYFNQFITFKEFIIDTQWWQACQYVNKLTSFLILLLHTSDLDSFQSSLRSISWNDSCDLGPFLISMSSISKIRVLSGGIFPEAKQRHTNTKVDLLLKAI